MQPSFSLKGTISTKIESKQIYTEPQKKYFSLQFHLTLTTGLTRYGPTWLANNASYSSRLGFGATAGPGCSGLPFPPNGIAYSGPFIAAFPSLFTPSSLSLLSVKSSIIFNTESKRASRVRLVPFGVMIIASPVSAVVVDCPPGVVGECRLCGTVLS